MSEIQKNIWFRSEGAILLNAFISSKVVWSEKDMRITQTTEYPDSLFSTLSINVAEPTQFKLKEDAVKAIKINSKPVELVKENGYIVIERFYNDGDKIEIEINASLHLIPLQGDEDSVAVMYGNVLLVQIGSTRTLKGVSNHTINQIFINSEKDKLEFSVDDGQGNEIYPFIQS